MRLSWQVRPLPGGGWEGFIEIPWGNGGLAVRGRASSPGEALEQTLTRADRVVAAAEESGFIPIGDIFSTVLSTASDIARSVGGRARRGEPPTTEATATLPGPLAKVASVSAMRPGGYGPPPGFPPGPWAWPGGYGPPPAPGYGYGGGYGYRPS